MIIKIDEHISLEQIDLNHSQAIFDLVSENRNYLRQWLPWVENMKSVTFIQNYITGSQLRNMDGIEYAFVILENDKVVGRIGIYKIDNQNKIGEIGYWVSQELQGKGIVTKSCKALVDYCFNDLHLNRIEIKCAVDNHKSQVIPERLDFNCEGILQQAELIRDVFIDLKLYAITSDMWKQ